MNLSAVSNSVCNPQITLFPSPRAGSLDEARITGLKRRIRRALPPLEAGLTIGWAMASLSAAALAIAAS